MSTLTKKQRIRGLKELISLADSLERRDILPKTEARDVRANAQALIELAGEKTVCDVGYDEEQDDALSEIEGRYKI